MSKFTLIGAYNYDHNLFESLNLPDGIDKTTCINNILMKSAEFELLYSDISFIKDYIGVLSNKWQTAFNKWVNVSKVEYDPLSNYDRHEQWTDNSDTTDHVEGSNDGFVSAFDSNTMQPNDQSKTVNDGKAKSNTVHNGHIFGNIGVTKAQEMYRDEVSLYKDVNVYDLIADVFVSELCIMIY